MQEIISALKDFICTNIIAENIKIESDTVLKDIGVDSFSIIEIVLFIERKFGKLIPDHLLVSETFATLESMAKVVLEIEE